MLLGLTGGLGCGKSTAAKLFADRAFRHVDSDLVVREQVLTTESVRAELRKRHGDAIFTPEGQVDRAVLGKIVFSDDSERHYLEALTHPLYFGILRETFRGTPGADWIVEVPLLFERAMENWFDFTLCVACDPLTQLARL
jgi:dephospho-CoA kinase